MPDDLVSKYAVNNDGPLEEERQHLMGEVQRHEISLREQLSHITDDTSLMLHSSNLLRIRQLQLYIINITRRIPREVMLNIFTHMVSDDTIESVKNRYTINMVCRLWRQLVAIIPQTFLICIIDRTKLKTYSLNAAEILQDQTTSSLRLHLSTIEDTEHPSFTDALPHFHSVRDLSLTYHPRIHTLANKIARFPHLQTLKLQIPPDFTADECQLAWFSHAAALVDVEIESSMLIRIPFPVANLKRYKERCVDTRRFIYTMIPAPKLEELSYTFRNPIAVVLPGPVTRNKWRSSAMKQFECNIYSAPAHHVDYLSDLTFPELQRIRIREEHDDIMQEIHAFMVKSGGSEHGLLSLTHLSVHSTPLVEGQLLKLLKVVPNLTYLECDAIPTCDIRALRTQTAKSAVTTWSFVPNISTLIIHDAIDIRDIEELALARNLSVKLMFRDAKQRDSLAVYCGAHISSALDDVIDDLLNELDMITEWLHDPSEASRSPGSEIANFRRRSDNILDDLQQLSCPSPRHMRLSVIHGLFQFTTLDLGIMYQYNMFTVLKRSRELLDKFITIYQLRLPATCQWVAPGRNCLLFDIQEEDIEWKANHPSDYELLYGRYRAPTREEVFWPYEDWGRFSPDL